MGLICLMVGVLAIISYGLAEFGSDTLNHPLVNLKDPSNPLPLFPESVPDTTIFIGVATFCFGLSSLAFPIEESMEKKEDFQKAVFWSLLFVWAIYVVIGDAGSLLYLHDPDGISDNILINLPEKSLAAALVRLSMALVCVLTFPLTFVPPAQMLEYYFQNIRQKLKFWNANPYQTINDGDEAPYTEPTLWVRLLNRSILVGVCTLLATAVPCFGMIISILGCFTVAILSFVLPPLFHLYIITVPNLTKHQSAIMVNREERERLENEAKNHYYRGVAHTVGGILLSIIATSVTVYDVISKLESGHGCSA